MANISTPQNNISPAQMTATSVRGISRAIERGTDG